jgi:formylglycine-generating enzyme required for sulfatase activity
MFLHLLAALAIVPPSSPSDLRGDTGIAGHADYVETIPGTKVKFTMVAVRGGKFTIGSPKDEKGRKDDEGPQRKVRLRPFWIGKCEVTWDEFQLFFKAQPFGDEVARRNASDKDKAADAVTKPTGPYIDETYGFGDNGYPAFNMSHHAAMKYCEWLTKKTGRLYRLPTEAEWEYACRAGTDNAYGFGGDADKLSDFAWFAKNSATEEHAKFGQTHPVGKKKPNAWGLQDMHGNVREWCLDHYVSDFYETFPTTKTAFGPVKLPTERRFSHVARGGCYRSTAAECRSAARLGSAKRWLRMDPQFPQSIWWLAPGEWVGFRLVSPVDEYDVLIGIKSRVTTESE